MNGTTLWCKVMHFRFNETDYIPRRPWSESVYIVVDAGLSMNSTAASFSEKRAQEDWGDPVVASTGGSGSFNILLVSGSIINSVRERVPTAKRCRQGESLEKFLN